MSVAEIHVELVPQFGGAHIEDGLPWELCALLFVLA